MRDALANAEQRLTDYLGFSPAPRAKEFLVNYARYYDERMWRIRPVDGNDGWVSVSLPEGYIQAVGVENLTLLDEVAVTYSDPHHTGINDTFTVTLPTDETDPANLRVYFIATDRLDDDLARWRVEPIQVSIASGIATITGNSWLLVVPEKYQGYRRTAQPLDATNVDNYVTQLAVYQVSIDANANTLDTAQGLFEWDSLPYPQWAWFCGVDNIRSTDPHTQAQALIRVGVRDERRGWVIPGRASYNNGTWEAISPYSCSTCRPPDRVIVRAIAGYPLNSNRELSERLQRAVTYLALADMPEKICACEDINKVLYRYQAELNRTSRDLGTETWAVTRSMLNCPLGNRRGHWYAWNEVLRLNLARGASAASNGT